MNSMPDTDTRNRLKPVGTMHPTPGGLSTLERALGVSRRILFAGIEFYSMASFWSQAMVSNYQW
jgi:hypothetical protein